VTRAYRAAKKIKRAAKVKAVRAKSARVRKIAQVKKQVVNAPKKRF
jgi:hypothetical protein